MLSCIFACLANCMWQRFFFSLNRNNLSTLDTWSVLKKSLTVMTRLKKTSSISLPERLFVSNAATWNVMKRQSARASQSHAKLSTPPRGALSYRPAVLLKKRVFSLNVEEQLTKAKICQQFSSLTLVLLETSGSLIARESKREHKWVCTSAEQHSVVFTNRLTPYSITQLTHLNFKSYLL